MDLELGYLITDLMKYEGRVIQEGENATDEEIDAFISIFMKEADHYEHGISSYGLKHACERAIGYIFRRQSSYAYVSNKRFKEAMHRAFYKHKGQYDKDTDINEIYKFRWRKGAIELFNVTGVYGTVHNTFKE